MKYNIYKIFFTLVCIVLGIWSCKDEVDYVLESPEINIDMGQINSIYYYNEVLKLNPSISLGTDSITTNADNYSYRWSYINTDKGSISKIAEGKSLDLTLDSIGVLNLYFEIENNETHIISTLTTVINVESVTNQGWYVLKETAEGNTEVDGFYLSAAEGDYDIIKQKLGASLSGVPRGFSFSNYYKYKPYKDSTFYYTASSLMVFSNNDALAYNVNNATPIIQLNEMFFLEPEEANQNIKATMLSSNKVFVSMENGAYTMNGGNPAFFPVIEGDYSIDNLLTCGSYGNTLAFDNKNKSFMMFGTAGTYTSDTVGYFQDVYGEFNNGLEVSVNHMNGEAIFMENTQRGSGYSSKTYVYSLFKEDNNADDLILYGINYDVFVEGLYYHYPVPNDYSNYTVVRAGEYSPIDFMKRLSMADYPMLVSADLYAMHKNSNLLYFAKSNAIGLYNIDDDTVNENFITDIPADEEITFMKYINSYYNTNDENFTGLVVATYISSTDTYKVYNYQLNGLTSVNRQERVKTGNGRVEKVLYISPSAYSWSSDLYQYN